MSRTEQEDLWEGRRGSTHEPDKSIRIPIKPMYIVKLGGDFKHVFINFKFSTLLGEMIKFDSYVSIGLKPPPRKTRDIWFS